MREVEVKGNMYRQRGLEHRVMGGRGEVLQEGRKECTHCWKP